MIPPAALPRAAIVVADRLITALVTLAHAVADLADLPIPTIPDHAIHTLFLRLSTLVATLIRISHFGLPTPRQPNPAPPDRPPPEPARTTDRPTPGLPRRPGWLLAALPDIAPAIAADLGALLADPALAALLAAAPTLNRSLRSLLRALGVSATSDAPPPSATPSPKPAARPTTTPPRRAGTLISTPTRRNRPSQQASLCAQIVPHS